MTKIYTKKGDKGETSLIGGYKVAKNDPRIEAYGTVDELNSTIGVAIAEISNVKFQISNIKNELIKVQNDLFEIGSVLANPNTKKVQLRFNRSQDLKKRVREIEKFIDKLQEELPELKNFILPGGGEAGSLLHFTRTVARRAERRVVEVYQKEVTDPQILVYLNRISDLFFVMARYLNFKEGVKEIIWSKK